jgi:hypothetical protein
VFAFGAKNLLPHEPARFIVNIVNAVLLEGFDSVKAMPDLLKSAESIGTHTSVIHIHRGTFSEYTWCDPKRRPNGNVLLQQCPKCFCLRKFNLSSRGKEVISTCHGKTTAGKKCGHNVVYLAPESGAKVNMVNQDGRWVVNSFISTLAGS